MAAHCKLPFALHPGLTHGNIMRTKEITKENVTRPLILSADAMKEGVGRNRNCSSPPAPSSSAPALHFSSRSRSPHSDTSLPASSSDVTSLPASVGGGSPAPPGYTSSQKGCLGFRTGSSSSRFRIGTSARPSFPSTPRRAGPGPTSCMSAASAERWVRSSSSSGAAR